MSKSFQRQFYINVQLISEEHPRFILFKSKFRTGRPGINHEKVRLKSQIISGVLERVAREWVKASHICLHDNIISYDILQGKTYRPLIKEVDYIYQKGNNFVLGEIKVSNQRHGHVPTAYGQLIESKHIMSVLSKVSELQIIRIDTNFRNTEEPLDQFVDDFSKMVFQTKEYENELFKYVHVSAKDIFNWGVKKGIVKTPELLDAAIEETELSDINRKFKADHKLLKKQIDENSSPELLIQLLQLEKRILLCSIKMDLNHKGWTHLSDMNQQFLSEILDGLGKVIFVTDVVVKQDSKALVTSDRPLDYHTDHHKAKYIVWYCFRQTDIGGETILIDAEKVYQRLTDGDKKELEKIELFEHKIFEDDLQRIPLVTNKGRRKFYYSFWLVNKDQANNKSLKEFQRIIREAALFKFHLKPNDILIIDNHRILHGRTAIEGNKDRFLKRFWISTD